MKYEKLNKVTRTIIALLLTMGHKSIDMSLQAHDSITIVVEHFENMYKWGGILNITITNDGGNVTVTADCDGYGIITEDNIENVIFYFAGEHGAEDIYSVKCI